MRLDPAAFNRHLNHMGQRFLFRSSAACPCTNQYSGAADPQCPQCAGKGHFWGAPVEAMAGVAGQRTQREWAQFGRYEAGDIVLSIPSDTVIYGAAEFDRLVALNADEGFSLALTRGDNDAIDGRVLSVSRVFWLDQQKQIVEGGIPAVGDDGALTWASGEPPVGTQYSVSGRRHPEYFIYTELPSSRAMHSGADLPRRVVARRFDLFGR